ncbi:peptidoglycan-binding domain-containing protein [Kitasatospora herbaricolor]|uniref:Peptidoglycan-binding protein n=1 Tax=Kitasatospora herbaricolor TaxID=68217 RepID=A0ABZ1WHX5_9ACTN|nr:peptidoglycan-binding domain-containing protein [Kitasatospora herbaricolor]
MSPPPNSLSDAELGEMLLSASGRRAAVRERTRRYGDVLLAYAGRLCATPGAAATLTAEVLDRTLDAEHRDQGLGPSWICLLLGEARLLAAGRAATGRGDDLSPAFRKWLSVRRAPHQSYRDVVATAEENCPLLGALVQLPHLQVAELWQSLAADAGAGPAPAAHPEPSAQARRNLADTYVRTHAVGAPDRRCRHLAALLADMAATDTAASSELAAHLSQCGRCRGALADLRAVHRWERDHLRDALLVRFRPTTAGRPKAVPATAADNRPGFPGPAASERPSGELVVGPARRRTRRATRRRAAHRRLAIGAAGVGAVALALGLTPAETQSPPTRALRLGDSGPEVVRLQKLLVRAACAPADSVFERGRFDPATERALVNFQRAADVRGDERALAVYGPRTRAALEQSVAGARCPSVQAPPG